MLVDGAIDTGVSLVSIIFAVPAVTMENSRVSNIPAPIILLIQFFLFISLNPKQSLTYVNYICFSRMILLVW